jgi:hypothetical protein
VLSHERPLLRGQLSIEIVVEPAQGFLAPVSVDVSHAVASSGEGRWCGDEPVIDRDLPQSLLQRLAGPVQP